jgi:hypothetical protein
LIALMMMSLQSFSQNVIDSTSIRLKKPIVRLVIKDLITGDGAKSEVTLVRQKVELLETKLLFKDSVIFNLNERVINFESMLNTQTNQLQLSKQLSDRLQTDLKKQKVKTKLTTGAGILVAVGIVILTK